MIEEYKEFIKKNSDDVYTMFTAAALLVVVLVSTFGILWLMNNVSRTIESSVKYQRYQEQLLEYKECASKIKEPLMVDTYCGRIPSDSSL